MNPSHPSPLIEGFRQTVHPDAAMSIKAMAQAYGVCARTIHRWRRAGVCISDPFAVSRHLAAQKNPSLAAIEAVTKILP